MPTYSQITITFNEDFGFTNKIHLSYGLGTLIEGWKTLRQQPNVVTIGTPTDIIGERTAINYIQALTLDYPFIGLAFSRLENEVTILATNPEFQFSVIEIVGNASINLDNTTIDSFNIVDVSFLSGDCDKVDVYVTTDNQAKNVTQPVTIDPVTSNPIVFEYERGITIYFETTSVDGIQIGQIIKTPSKLFSASIEVSQNTSPQGTTVIVNVINNGLVLDYSLDGLEFFADNSFASLASGEYMVTVRDQFGCTATKTFEVFAFEVIEPDFYISKSNSFVYAERVDFGLCSNQKNDENTLSCEENVKLPKEGIQIYQSCDGVITTQFRSSYPTINATVIEGANTFNPIINKLTENIGRTDQRDARRLSLAGGLTGFYFTSGKIYDFATGAETGETYLLNGGLPEWGVIGNYLRFNGAYYQIEDIIFSEEKAADMLIVKGLFSFSDVPAVVGSQYNREKYELYEFDVNLSNYQDKIFQVKILNQSPYAANKEVLTEKISVKEKHEHSIVIDYKNRVNTDMNYGTGISNKIRLFLQRINGKPIQTNENLITDTATILLEGTIRESNTFEFAPVTKSMMWKAVTALSQSNVIIDGVAYVKESVIETENLGETNLYDISATMVKAGGSYKKDNSANEINIEIPKLIDSGANAYLKYR